MPAGDPGAVRREIFSLEIGLAIIRYDLSIVRLSARDSQGLKPIHPSKIKQRR